MEEIWKDIEGYEGLYQVSNFGRIKSIGYKKEKILKTRKDSNGYILINLFRNKKYKTFRLHRLVAENFIPNPENKPCIDHINTIKTDNRVENLRWVTHKENNNNEISLKKLSESLKGKIRKEETKDKLRKVNTVSVYCLELDKIFFSISQCARELNLDISAIVKVCKGKKKTCGGYHFKYFEREKYDNKNII